MGFTVWAGLSGFGFVLLAVGINVVYVRGRLPLPVSPHGFDAVAESFAAVGEALKRPSVAAPAGWACVTIFAAGMLSVLWDGGSRTQAWALVGFAGVLMQNATFTVVEALRFGMAEAATRNRDAFAGLWSLSNVLFGFNQVFLALALVGFTAAGSSTGFLPGWHTVLGYISAALLFASASISPYNATGTHKAAPIGFVGWLGWAAWIVASSIALLRQ
ncbi:2-oxoglutarate/malate transporter [Nocardia beijingensis]|uniref:2-oxoglutarate/malate transporter n=1 Tax=Nocardia beijingensis TaxID=95162 RepID=UPI0033B60301